MPLLPPLGLRVHGRPAASIVHLIRIGTKIKSEFGTSLRCSEEDLQKIWHDLELIVGNALTEHHRVDSKLVLSEIERGAAAASDLLDVLRNLPSTKVVSHHTWKLMSAHLQQYTEAIALYPCLTDRGKNVQLEGNETPQERSEILNAIRTIDFKDDFV